MDLTSKFISNYGLHIIAEEIFSNLDWKDLVNCHQVSKIWNHFILNSATLLRQKIRQVNKLRISKRKRLQKSGHPLFRSRNTASKWEERSEWKIEKKLSVSQLKIYLKLLQGYSIYHFANPLRYAIDNFKDDFVEMMIHTKSIDFMAPDEEHNDETRFHQACEHGSIKIIRLLIENSTKLGISNTARDGNGNTPFHRACMRRASKAKLSLFLESADKLSLDVNAINKDGNTPLHLACLRGSYEVINAFLETNINDIDWNATNSTKNTPFHYACKMGVPEVVKVFFHQSAKQGLDLNIRNSEGLTPFHISAWREHDKMDIIRMFLEFSKSTNIDLNAQDYSGLTALHHAIKVWNNKVVKTLVSDPHFNDVNFSLTDNLGRSPLHHACMKGNHRVVRMLLEGLCYDPSLMNTPDVNGLTPLQIAKEKGCKNVIRQFDIFMK